MSHEAEQLIPKDDVQRTFLLARGMAIAKYSLVETSLVMLFAHFMGTSEELAGVPFFKITATRSRSASLDRLKKKRYGDKHNLYWNSLIKLVGELDNKRNEIVHWGGFATVLMKDKESVVTDYALTPPNFWDRTDDTPTIKLNDIYDFILKCDFVEKSLNMLLAVLTERSPVQSWLDICQQPVTYPPPDKHPLSQRQTVR